jgi:hypothetical protein
MSTPLKTIRKNCIECCNGSSNEVELCQVAQCKLYPFRYGKKPKIKIEGSALQNIKKHCYECSIKNHATVRNCHIPECALYIYRLGHNPKRAGMGGNIKERMQNKIAI